MAVSDYQKAWRYWIDSDEGKSCLNTSNFGVVDTRYLQNRLNSAFDAGWNGRSVLIELDRKPPKYESMTIAIDDEKGHGYQAFHEAIQDGWEPLFHWTDEFGQHVALRRFESYG